MKYGRAITLGLGITILVGVSLAEAGNPYGALKIAGSHMAFDDMTAESRTSGDQTRQYDRNDSDIVPAIGGALGYAFDAPIRLELDYTYRDTFRHRKHPTNNGLHNVDIDLVTQSLLVQAYYDIGTGTAWTPFVGAGVGLAHHRTDNRAVAIPPATNSYEGDRRGTWRLAWSLGAGVSYAVAANIAVDLSYRYVDLGRVGWRNHAPSTGDDGRLDADMAANEITLGLRYTF